MLSILTIVGLFAGLYQDLVRPVVDYFKGLNSSNHQIHKSDLEDRSPETKSLRDLFLTDFENTSMRGTYHLTSNSKTVYTVEYIIWCDFDSKTKYLSLFLPDSDYTYNASLYLINQYEDILDGNIRKLMEGMIRQAPGEKPESFHELAFSGRIYMYHERYLLPDRIQTLTEKYKMANLSPMFRGRDYLIMKNSPLYDE